MAYLCRRCGRGFGQSWCVTSTGDGKYVCDGCSTPWIAEEAERRAADAEAQASTAPAIDAPYTAAELAEFRERRLNVLHTLDGPLARFMATVDALQTASRAYLEARDRADPAAEREARKALEALL